MNTQSGDTPEAVLAAEAEALRATLRSLVAEIHDGVRPRLNTDRARVDEIELEIRRIVLRIVQVERDRIEVRIANAL